MNNPFLLVYEKLWTMVEDRVVLDALVRPKNRIRFDSTARPDIKPNIQVADLPELMLVSENVSGNLHQTSNSTQLTRTYSWVISTGDMKLLPVMNLEWELLRAMLTWDTKLTALTWKDKQFVKRTQVLDIASGESDPERNRGIRGWSAVWRCEVEFHFLTADLRAND